MINNEIRIVKITKIGFNSRLTIRVDFFFERIYRKVDMKCKYSNLFQAAGYLQTSHLINLLDYLYIMLYLFQAAREASMFVWTKCSTQK